MSSHAVSLNSGYATVYLEGHNRPNTIIRIVRSTSFIGGPGIYFDLLHHYTIAALTDTTICNADALFYLFDEVFESKTISRTG